METTNHQGYSAPCQLINVPPHEHGSLSRRIDSVLITEVLGGSDAVKHCILYTS